MSKNKSSHQYVSEFVDQLQSSGRYWFRGEEVISAVERSDIAIEASLRRLKEKHRVVMPRRGFYVIVPAEYRNAGAPPAEWFIDALMAYQEQPYYVGLLSAAAFHGAAHQQPQVFQVMISIPIRPIVVGRVRIQFYKQQRIDQVPIQKIKTETGFMRVSTPEATALDLVKYPEAAGHLNNVATVLAELSEIMKPDRLCEAAVQARTPELQRLGYLLDQLKRKQLSDPLHELLLSQRRRPIYLRSDKKGRKRKHEPRWYIIPNEKVDIDL